jgi:membrane-associated phospholipid phosphatase
MRPSERLTLVAVLLLSVVTAAVRPEGGALRLLFFLGIASATALLASAPPGRGVGFLRDWLPVGAVLGVFLLLQPIIEAAVPWRLDATLAALDARYFPRLVAAWHGAFGRPTAFTDAIYLAYVSYYLLPITVAAVAWRRGPGAFERTAFALLLGFYLTFLGYLVLPASGPRLPIAAEAGLLGGGAISDGVRTFLHGAESTTLDAFPSGHTAIAVISGVLGGRLLGRGAAVALWAWAAAIVFATVYIHVHYAVDVAVGLALAAFVLAVSPLPEALSAGGVTAPPGSEIA